MDMNIKIHLETHIKYKIKKIKDVLGLNVHPPDRLGRKQSYSLS